MKKNTHYPIFWVLLIAFFKINAQTYQVPVYTVTSAQQAQSGEEAYFMIDDNDNTIYHSQWNNVGIPDTLDFYFTQQVQSINQIIYTPRQSGLNGVWTNVTLYYATQSNPEIFIPIFASNLVWSANNQNKTINLPDAISNPAIIRFVVNAGYGNFSSCAEMRFYSEEAFLPDNGIDCSFSTSELVSGNNDIKATILTTGTTASSFQTGENINRSFDNNLNTLYHSSYNSTVFPVLLNYRFNGNTIIDYLKYIPRSDGATNGNFGNVVITYNTSDTGIGSEFLPLVTFDFGELGMPVVVDFPFPVTPRNIRISVENGSGNFASCAEMEFYTKVADSGTELPYATIFANDIYSELQNDVTQTDIDNIESDFYRSLAQCLFDQTYNHQYRVQNYEIYPRLSTIRNTLKIGNYDAFENATGIVFSAGEKAVVFAKDISSTPVFLRIKDFANEENPADSSYQLQNGLNIIDILNNGLGYISYFGDNETTPDITLNIASGVVNGYFDRSTSTNQDWIELLSGSHYSKLDVRGEFTHLVYDKAALISGSPFDGHSLISRYDTIVNLQRLQMGLYKYDKSPKNRQLAYSGYGGGWYAGGLGIHLDLEWGVESITSPTGLGLWGVAHELGHINQIRPDIDWHGLAEVSNNIYSTWATYHLNTEGNNYTRLESEIIQPSAGLPSVAGGRINGFIEATHINNEALQGASDYDVFRVLVPFWQLQLYYQLAGAAKGAPLLTFEEAPEDYTGVDYANWFGTVAEISRNTNSNGLTTSQLLLNFVKNTCDAVQEDLTDFFINTGFLRPLNVEIDDYGVQQVIVTQNEIDQTIAYIQNQGYAQPESPVISYISAHSVEMFREQLPLSGQTGEGVTLMGNTLLVQHSEWQNAVAYETYNQENELIHIAISGTGDTTNQTTRVHYPAGAYAVYAVGFDGQKILVYPSDLSVHNNELNHGVTIYPNPVGSNDVFHIKLKNTEEDFYTAQIVSLDGKTVFRHNGNIENIEKSINEELVNFAQGTYILNLYNALGAKYHAKFVKK